MTKAQVEVITSVQRRRLVAGGEGTDCCRGYGARRGCLRGCACSWDLRQPTVPLAPATLRASANSSGVQSGSVAPEPEAASPTSPEKAGVIEIEFAGGGRMRISGLVDASRYRR